ncbi:telethonin-like [Hyperolius riggenbachi]|uniref:telethonin-like n=1 Tax=Hyperolius riggenbachi TaxID=752182 RepID=UPI0035A26A87
MDFKDSASITCIVLSCCVQEEDVIRRESCTLQWDDLTVDTRPEERVALSESDSEHEEKYEKQQQTVFIVQRSPLQIMRAGILGGKLRDYQLPYKTHLPVPLFMPTRLNKQDNMSAEEQYSELRMTHSNGLSTEKHDITGLVSNLPKVIQPAKLRVSSLISPPPNLYDANLH